MQLPALLAACLAVSVATLTGCYSRENLIEHARDRATRSWIDEIDLGSFRVTLPSNASTGEFTEVDVHLFGAAPRYQHNEINELLESRMPMIKDAAYSTLRETPSEQLVDPKLTALRERLLGAFNQHLGETPLKEIGFHDIRFLRH